MTILILLHLLYFAIFLIYMLEGLYIMSLFHPQVVMTLENIMYSHLAFYFTSRALRAIVWHIATCPLGPLMEFMITVWPFLIFLEVLYWFFTHHK